MSALWPKALEVLVVPQGYQTQITDASQAHIIALALLSVLNKRSPHYDLTVGTTSMLTVSRWALDVCHRLLRTSRSCFDTPSQDMDRILSILLFIIFEAYPIDDPSSKAGPLLDLLVEVLWAFKHYGGTTLHSALDEKIHYLLREDQHPTVVEACKRRFLPLLGTRKTEDIEVEQDDFQVSASYTFSAAQISTTCKQLLDTIHHFFYAREQGTNDGDIRPSKRQRIGDNHEKDSWEVAYSGLLKSVTSQLAYEARDVVLDLSDTAL